VLLLIIDDVPLKGPAGCVVRPFCCDEVTLAVGVGIASESSSGIGGQ
jgi:hypothetical protein